ncbi:hypothetical protein HT136_19570 [Novosphingobium profundi]|uniref:hypothetical protein n=1 Tax=Novosphingobium profundi TaxID=1774954 RepID=UPI001BD93721|nr:hypothetical protein [Novosphingobium profundi]MBT0670571.1 hypothetical protein [Novosphingobium profundi]
MSVDQRPARLKVYSSGQAAAARDAILQPDAEAPSGVSAGGVPALAELPNTTQTYAEEEDAGVNVLVWCLAGVLIFMIGCVLGGGMLIGWLIRNGYFS